MSSHKRSARSARVSTNWDRVADWYNGWVGDEGSKHHRHLAIPAVLELLDLHPGEHVLDLGAGSGDWMRADGCWRSLIDSIASTGDSSLETRGA